LRFPYRAPFCRVVYLGRGSTRSPCGVGKWLLRTSGLALTAEELAAAYVRGSA
jgi:hypothetical protein